MCEALAPDHFQVDDADVLQILDERVTDENESLIERVVAASEKLGRLDIVVNNAGITRDKMLLNMTDDEFDQVPKVHLRGHFLLAIDGGATATHAFGG